MSRYELKNFSDPSTSNEEMGSVKSNGGCYIKTVTGFIISLLFIAIAVGVGLIVHFAENRNIECVFPDGTSVSSGQAQQGPCPQATAAPGCPVCPTTQQPSGHPTGQPAQTTTKSPSQTRRDVRLPKDLLPTHYVLSLRPEMYGPNPSEFVFTGRVSIELDCMSATDKVILHAHKLTVSNIQFGGGPRYVSHELDEDLQQLRVTLTEPTQKGSKYTLSMDFQGPLLDDLQGLYLSSYMDGDRTVYLATTQFEPTDARKAFPCFDEPAMKSTFKVTLTRKSSVMSLSNMPVERTISEGNGYESDVYLPTKKMSTYLLAFIVGEFKGKFHTVNANLTYGAWARPMSINQTDYALDVGWKTILNYNKYFDIPFPLPKQDMIAIPDFGLGAMENWGLITYRETAMLYHEGVASEANRQRVTTVITHELAHQWFGDLVTMDWWDDIWLNEGFATFVEYLGASMLNPDWKMYEQFVIDDLHPAFELDSLVTSHPIYVPVYDPDEIHEVFDGISYSKGGSIIRMMRFFLGESTFQKGLTRYLNSRRYANAFHDHLWTSLGEQSAIDGAGLNVKAIMDTWTLQMNYPVVKVTLENGNLVVSQSRFLKNADALDTGKYQSPFGYKWKIPFTYTTSRSPNFNVTAADISWLDGDSKNVGSLSLDEGDWVLGNVQQYGVYRVTYSDSNWNALVKQLKRKHEVISNINRAQIINDAWSLSRAHQLSTEIALSSLDYLDQETEYVPWMAAMTQIEYVDNMLRKTGVYGKFQSFMLSKLSGAYSYFGIDDTNATHVESLTRSRIVQMACSYGLQDCITQAQKLFGQWMDNPNHNPIDPDLRPAVYCTAVAEGGSDVWDFLFDKFLHEPVVTEKVVLSRALACTRETWLLSRYLELAIDPNVVRKQDAVHVLVYIAENPVGEPLAWDFVRGKWDYLRFTYGTGVFSFASLINGLTAAFNTEFQLSQLRSFLEQYPDMGTGSRAFQQAMEKTQTNIKWMERNKDVVDQWLDNLGVTQETRVKDVRLPDHLIPESYDVTLQPDMYGTDPEKFMFSGYVKIYMTADKAGRNVTVHANKLTIDENSIKFGLQSGGPGGPQYNGQRQHDKDRQFEIFYLNEDVEPGQKYYIEMNFTGPLIGDLAGLYLSQYKRNNNTIYIATTQFEPTDARKAFPCFDEPQLKAVFNVKLVRKAHMKSISNMPIISNQNLADNWVMDVYNTSAKMSTYLLAFIVCDFEYTTNTTRRGTVYRAWSRPESINQTKVALDAGCEIISFYEEYFGADFPLPKQDMIAIPDFAAGAMENWGLITYRETAMLYEPGVSSEGNLQRVNVVVAHELAHQWFGDLVTMDWWDDLWLNEGFASFVEYMGTDHVHPDWKMFEQFVFEIYSVFSIDALVTSHPIYVPVQNPDEINEIFDTISYAKGGSVIRMMRFFLGEETFKLGLQLYIQQRKYQNAYHDDLWKALAQKAKERGNNLDVVGIMNTWILQMNYPVVMVTKAANGNIKLTQNRFLLSTDVPDPGVYKSPYNYKWMIPFTYTTSTSPKFNVTSNDVEWLNDKEKEIASAYPAGTSSWILGNIQQYGVYRVNYDDANWQNLINQLKKDHTVISAINRGQLINDAFGLAKAKQLKMEIALQTLDYLSNETEYVPWTAADDELGYISTMLAETELYGAFQRFMLEKVGTQFKRLTMNNTGSTHLDSYIRSTIASDACFYGNDDCIKEATDLFAKYMKNKQNNPIDPGLKSTVYCTAIREGGEAEWNFAYNLYKGATVQAEKSRLLSALSCTRQVWILNKLLNLALDDSIIRKQDAYKVFIGVGRNVVGRSVAWDFFRGRWDDIFETYGTGSFSLSDIISGVTSSFNTEFQLEQLKEFGKAHSNMGSGTRAYAQTIENTMANIRWMEENYSIVDNWLEKYIL